MKINKYIIICILFSNLNLAISENNNFPLIAIDHCTNTNLANEAPYLPAPDLIKFQHYKNVMLSHLFKPQHIVHDLILNEQQPIMLHAKFAYDWFLHKALKDEYVHVYFFADHTTQWLDFGKFKTDSNGEIFIPLKQKLLAGDYLVRIFVEGDGSIAEGFISIISPKHQAIVFDIDGTLTLSDFELLKDLLSISIASPYYYASEVLESYSQKGYELIFLTARPYWMATVSRDWLKNVLFHDPWPLKTRNTLLFREGTAQFKANYLKDLIQEKHLTIVRAYGNAMTDIEAYNLAGIPKKDTFIIGPNAGKQGTNPIQKDYFNHYYNIVMPTPLAACRNN
ncbi:hypothetical protein ACNVED_14885 (plasmid) [Legionella sp. D16C41]|uniref:LNS2 domain-containing protein n=1 Tax=Legionella sp. D16C41 TaxID=3402688 RepID=UPI003AF7FA23